MRKFSQNRIGNSAKRIAFAMVLTMAFYLIGNIGATFSAQVFSDIERSADNTFKAGIWSEPEDEPENGIMESQNQLTIESFESTEEEIPAETPDQIPPPEVEPEIVLEENPEPPAIEPLEPIVDPIEPPADDPFPIDEETSPEEEPIESPVDGEI